MLLSSTVKRVARRATGPPPPARHEALQFSQPPDNEVRGLFLWAAMGAAKQASDQPQSARSFLGGVHLVHAPPGVAPTVGVDTKPTQKKMTSTYFPTSARSERSAVDGKQQLHLPERNDARFLACEGNGVTQAVIQRPGA